MMFEAVTSFGFFFVVAEAMKDTAKILRSFSVFVGSQLKQDVQGDGSDWDREPKRFDEDGGIK